MSTWWEPSEFKEGESGHLQLQCEVYFPLVWVNRPQKPEFTTAEIGHRWIIKIMPASSVSKYKSLTNTGDNKDRPQLGVKVLDSRL